MLGPNEIVVVSKRQRESIADILLCPDLWFRRIIFSDTLGWNVVLLVQICIVLATGLPAKAQTPTGSEPLKQLVETSRRVRTSESEVARRNAAERLPQIAKKVTPNEVDDKAVSDLVSLLDTWDDSVRVPVAEALGNLGPRARLAAPALLKILPEVDCLLVDVQPAPVIREALRRIGEAPPPPPACETTVDPVVWKQRLMETVRKVRTDESPVTRAKAAMHLAYLTRFLPSDEVDDTVVLELVSLLDIPEDPVRMGVTVALGSLGPRAKAAVPKLEELLPEVDCSAASAAIAQNMRLILRQAGVTPPPKCRARSSGSF
jgi:hypothetical protein